MTTQTHAGVAGFSGSTGALAVVKVELAWLMTCVPFIAFTVQR